MSTLTISHYIYLTKEQRYSLHNGNQLEVIGISVPVWFDKGNTSEPATEVFCKYKLTNDEIGKFIKKSEEGYEINLPQKSEFLEKDIPKEIKGVVEIQLGTSERLLDHEDGGVAALEFRQYTKIDEGRKYNIVHFVEIKNNEILSDTLS